MNQVDEVSDMVLLLCSSVLGRVQKGDNATAWPLDVFKGGNYSLELTLMPDTSVSLRMLLVPFHVS